MGTLGNSVCKMKKKKGQRDPHSHQLTEVSNPYLSLSLDIFCKAWAQHLFQVKTPQKKVRHFPQFSVSWAQRLFQTAKKKETCFFFLPCPAQAQKKTQKKKGQ